MWLDNFLRGESRSRVIETSPNTLQEILMELRIQRGKIDEKIEKMENRYSQLRRRCMEALRKGDRALAVIYANEAAFVRKIAHELLINRITFDRAILRLELLLELEGMSDILRSVREIVEALGATVVDYAGELDCCGGGTIAFNQKLGAALAKKKLDNVKRAGADAIVLFCPFCAIMYDGHQRFIEEQFKSGPYNIPVLFLPQLMGLAFGIDPSELGFEYNAVDVQPLLEKIGERK